jgi:hypothetical protein
MSHDRRIAGIGGILFTVLLAAGVIAANSPGGEYKESDVVDFVAKGHRSVVLISLFLMAAAGIALLVVMAYLCETSFGKGRSGRIAWGTSLFAAGSFLTGWAILITPSMSIALGGGPGIDPTVSYTIMQAGWAVFLVVSGMMLGISLLTLAIAGHVAPTWMRAFTGIVGLLALFSVAFFPFWAVLLWGLVIGIWLLVSSPREEPQRAAPSLPEAAS